MRLLDGDEERCRLGLALGERLFRALAVLGVDAPRDEVGYQQVGRDVVAVAAELQHHVPVVLQVLQHLAHGAAARRMFRHEPEPLELGEPAPQRTERSRVLGHRIGQRCQVLLRVVQELQQPVPPEAALQRVARLHAQVGHVQRGGEHRDVVRLDLVEPDDHVVVR